MALAHQLKQLGKLLMMLSLVVVGGAPLVAKAAGSEQSIKYEAAVAVKYSLSFGGKTKQPEWRMGLFVNKQNNTAVPNTGVLELRVTPSAGAHYAVFNKRAKQSPMRWAKQKVEQLTGKIPQPKWSMVLEK